MKKAAAPHGCLLGSALFRFLMTEKKQTVLHCLDDGMPPLTVESTGYPGQDKMLYGCLLFWRSNKKTPCAGANTKTKKTRIYAGLFVAEMEGFELWLDFLLCPKCTVNFVQPVSCFVEHRLPNVGVTICNSIRRMSHHFLYYPRVDTCLFAVGCKAVSELMEGGRALNIAMTFAGFSHSMPDTKRLPPFFDLMTAQQVFSVEGKNIVVRFANKLSMQAIQHDDPSDTCISFWLFDVGGITGEVHTFRDMDNAVLIVDIPVLERKGFTLSQTGTLDKKAKSRVHILIPKLGNDPLIASRSLLPLSRGASGGTISGIGRVKCDIAAKNGKRHRLADKLTVSNNCFAGKGLTKAVKESLNHCRSNLPNR